MMNQLDMMEIVQKYRGDAVVIPIFQANRKWTQVSTNPRRDYSGGGAMGKGSSFALGLALAQPDLKVILFDGDGSLEMNLGTMITIAAQKPKNLYHFVVRNGVYATTGGQPIAGQEIVSFADMARAAGYAASYHFDDLEDFANAAGRIFGQQGPVMVCVETVPEIRTLQERAAQMANPNPRRRTARQTIQELREELGTA